MTEMRENNENCALTDTFGQYDISEETLFTVQDELNRIGQENQDKISSSGSVNTNSVIDSSILDSAKLSILKVLAPIIDSRYL
jgi:hypothetical protein